MNVAPYLPRALRVYLLDQPIPEKWKKAIEQSLELGDPEEIKKKLELGGWKSSYNMALVLVIMVMSAFVIFGILN